ncbi:MAG: pseudouridine synthase [Bacteroidales bacterium]|jgi:23S rRNA pseudouridine2605 synthase|nr:pseudouridine synthase [Bacteroidales bacterium]
MEKRPRKTSSTTERKKTTNSRGTRKVASAQQSDKPKYVRKKREDDSSQKPQRGRKPAQSANYSDKPKYFSKSERSERPVRSKSPDREKRFEREKPDRAKRFDKEKREDRPNRDSRRRDFAEKKPQRGRNKPQESEKKKPIVRKESNILHQIAARKRETGRSKTKEPKVLSLQWSEERGIIRLNKYISNSGICSRREADTLILAGAVTVNGQVVCELGTKIFPTDVVRYEDKILQMEKPVYILLNKPTNYITTTKDERSRNNVMMLIEGACEQRVYPVGRLDRNTTGLLLFTNDGELTKKLTHPRYEMKKIYQVELDKDMSLTDFEQLANGIELSDGLMKPDEIAFVDGQKNVLGIAIHSGKNRVVRRLFEHLGYEVVKLDRVFYAGLTKKDLPRGSWRFLTQAEINILKMSL